MVLRSSSLSRNSAAVHCLSNAMSACSSLVLPGLVCAAALVEAHANETTSSSITISCFIIYVLSLLGEGGLDTRKCRGSFAFNGLRACYPQIPQITPIKSE